MTYLLRTLLCCLFSLQQKLMGLMGVDPGVKNPPLPPSPTETPKTQRVASQLVLLEDGRPFGRPFGQVGLIEPAIGLGQLLLSVIVGPGVEGLARRQVILDSKRCRCRYVFIRLRSPKEYPLVCTRYTCLQMLRSTRLKRFKMFQRNQTSNRHRPLRP